jgi:hypothetical protein
MVEFSKEPSAWNITLGAMTGNVIILKVFLFRTKEGKNTCLMGKLLVPLNVWRYNRDVAQTDVFVTELDRILEDTKITT